MISFTVCILRFTTKIQSKSIKRNKKNIKRNKMIVNFVSKENDTQISADYSSWLW